MSLGDYGGASFREALTMGQVPGAEYWGKFATGIVGTTPSTIMSANPAGQLLTYPSAPQTVWVASNNVNDTELGTGCRYIRIYGLDASFNRINERLALQGQTPVQSTKEYVRIYRMLNDDVEPHDCAGQIYLSLSGAGWVAGVPAVAYCHINDGYNQSQIGVYTVPEGYKLMVSNWWLNSMKDREVKMWMVIRDDVKCDGVNPEKVFRMRSNWGLYRDNINIALHDNPFIISSREEFEIRGVTDVTTEEVFTTLNGYLIPKKYFERQ